MCLKRRCCRVGVDIPIVVNEYGGAILTFEDEWNTYVKKQGLNNPWHTRMRVIKARIDGIPSKETMPTEKEFKSFQEQRNLFIAARVKDRFGYDKYVEFCGQHDLEPTNGPGNEPCKNGSGQCHIDCWQYGTNCL